ncbi:hypothetical protein EDB85DRAFT_2281905 [Lactarius pseudohatsudake]|nr:hypothetical protein EDB85DRAFT_2281905 [Lactarius pseudohatsudake]
MGAGPAWGTAEVLDTYRAMWTSLHTLTSVPVGSQPSSGEVALCRGFNSLDTFNTRLAQVFGPYQLRKSSSVGSLGPAFSPPGSARSQHSPVRTTAHSGLVRSVTTRFVPSLILSATDNALTGRGDRGVGRFSRNPSDSTLQLDEGRRVSSDSVYLRRSPASPLPLEFRSQPSLQQTHTVQHRRVASSRLATPARFETHTSGASCLLHSALPSSSSSALPTGRGVDSPSPTSRASSPFGVAADYLNRPRTSEDEAIGGQPSACERLGYIPRSRNRSSSVGNGNGKRVTSPGSRTATEWLGPRTAKAFAAAGLLGRDQDPSNSVSRFGSTRSLGDRDPRALSPSRLALGSVAGSWRSASQEMTQSDAMASTSTGYARETGTLLAALAAAQHIAQSLRTEDARLTKRVEDLEAQLHTQLRAQQPLARSVFSRVERQHSSDTLVRRCPPPLVPIILTHHLQNTTSSRDLDLKRQEDADAEDATYHGGRVARSRRASDSESVFALPPPNMSMLLQEQPAGSRRSASSISLATAGAETDGRRSPRSLFLRPEHELHLGDICSIFTEDDASDDEDGLLLCCAFTKRDFLRLRLRNRNFPRVTLGYLHGPDWVLLSPASQVSLPPHDENIAAEGQIFLFDPFYYWGTCPRQRSVVAIENTTVKKHICPIKGGPETRSRNAETRVTRPGEVTEGAAAKATRDTQAEAWLYGTQTGSGGTYCGRPDSGLESMVAQDNFELAESSVIAVRVGSAQNGLGRFTGPVEGWAYHCVSA